MEGGEGGRGGREGGREEGREGDLGIMAQLLLALLELFVIQAHPCGKHTRTNGHMHTTVNDVAVLLSCCLAVVLRVGQLRGKAGIEAASWEAIGAPWVHPQDFDANMLPSPPGQSSSKHKLPLGKGCTCPRKLPLLVHKATTQRRAAFVRTGSPSTPTLLSLSRMPLVARPLAGTHQREHGLTE